MKKAVRVFITGTFNSLFHKEFLKNNLAKYDVKGFLRFREDGRVELFIEGNSEDVDAAVAISKRGPQYAQIRNVEEKDEKFQGFRDFKILNF